MGIYKFYVKQKKKSYLLGFKNSWPYKVWPECLMSFLAFPDFSMVVQISQNECDKFTFDGLEESSFQRKGLRLELESYFLLFWFVKNGVL